MAVDVVMNLKIPGLTLQQVGEPDQVVNNTAVRFRKPASLLTVPKAKDTIAVTVTPDISWPCVVDRVDWSDPENLFIVSCHYAERRIPAHEYLALLRDLAWHRIEL